MLIIYVSFSFRKDRIYENWFLCLLGESEVLQLRRTTRNHHKHNLKQFFYLPRPPKITCPIHSINTSMCKAL